MTTNAPRIVCHMAVSLDGRINGTLFGSASMSAVDQYYDMLHTKFGTDTPFTIAGSTTARELAPREADVAALPAPTDAERAVNLREDFWDDLSKENRRPCVAVMDRRGVMAWNSQTPTTPALLPMAHYRIVSFLSPETASDALLAHLRRARVPYVFAGADGGDLREAARKVQAALGEDTLLLCGGGVVNGASIARGQVDELSFIYLPGLTGCPADRAVVEAPAEQQPAVLATEWDLLSVEAVKENAVWMRYARRHSAGADGSSQ